MDQISLPDSLLVQLRGFERTLKRVETRHAVGAGVTGLGAAFLLFFITDRFWDTPPLARCLFTVAGGSSAAGFAYWWSQHWWWQRRSPADFAKLLQRKFRSLGDRLQGVIELAETPTLPANVSPGLLRAALQQVTTEAGRFDFDAAVPVRTARRWTMAAGALALLASLLFVFVSAAACNSLARWLMPWKAVERYTFASLDALPSQLFVPYGESFDFGCGLRQEGRWQPQTMSAQISGQQPLRAMVKGGHATFRIPGQAAPVTLRLRAGDAQRELSLCPTLRPEMRQLEADVQLPSYLGYPPAHLQVQGGSVEFIEGSSVAFLARIGRHVAKAQVATSSQQLDATPTNDGFRTAAQPARSFLGENAFSWSDDAGLTPARAYKLKVSCAPDLEPQIELRAPNASPAILKNEILHLEMNSSDDFGIKEQWLEWTASAAGPTGKPANAEKPTSAGKAWKVAGAPMKKELAGSAEFAPALVNIPENTVVELTAYATDYMPGRKPVASRKIVVQVLSPAKHAERAQAQMEQALQQLDERIRDEERQLEESKAQADTKPPKSKDGKNDEIEKLAAGERSNEARVKELTEKVEAAVKDAMRNPQIPDATVADWRKIGELLQQKAAPSIATAADALEKATQAAADREPELNRAQKEQQEALAAMREAAQGMKTANESLNARNFYNRLRGVAQSERGIADGLRELVKETVGLRPEEIGDSARQDFDKVATQQDGATQDVERIVSDLAAFTKRLPAAKYEAVQREMQAVKISPGLHELAGFVRANLGLKSVGRARQWGKQLDAWAEMLRGEGKAGGGSGPGGGGEMDPELMEFVIGLVRTAVAEDEVRGETEILSRKPESGVNAPRAATDLAGRQDEVRKTAQTLLGQVLWSELKPHLSPHLPKAFGSPPASKLAEFEPLLTEVQSLMGEVGAALRDSRTDDEVLGTESTIVELLVPPDKKDDSGSSAQKMLRKMMAVATGSTSPGGNNGKGSAGAAGEPANGTVADASRVRRTVDQAGAGSSAEWPEEFREQLQAYFEKIDVPSAKP